MSRYDLTDFEWRVIGRMASSFGEGGLAGVSLRLCGGLRQIEGGAGAPASSQEISALSP